MLLIVFIFILIVVIYFVFIRKGTGANEQENIKSSNLPSRMDNTSSNRDKNSDKKQSNDTQSILGPVIAALPNKKIIPQEPAEPNISETLSHAKVDKMAPHFNDEDNIAETSTNRRIKFAPKKHQLAYDKRTGRILSSEYLLV